jgi:hypothetical protein
MTAVWVVVGIILAGLFALSLWMTWSVLTDPQARRDRDELRRRESLRQVLDAHTVDRP